MDLITIENDELCAVINPTGAVFHSILKDGIEYLWQGDSKYWKRRDANLFPYVGRLKNGHYWINGHRYSLGIHGFCLDTPFQIESR